MNLETRVQELRGVGKTRAASLAKLGIFTLRDLLYHFPRLHEKRSNVKKLGQFAFDEPASYILTVATEPTSFKTRNRLTISKFRAYDDSGSVEIVFYNAPYIRDVFKIGRSYRFYGKPAFTKNRYLNLTNPKYEEIIDGKPLENLVPVYSLTDGVSSKTIERLTRNILSESSLNLTDPLPEKVRLGNGLPTLSYAIKNIHFPEDEIALENSMRRLAFDEMFLFALGVAMTKEERIRNTGIPFKPCSIMPLLQLLPYKLTDAQIRAIKEIYNDIVPQNSGNKISAMSRILIGDVGSGKTICAIAAIYFSAKSGYQSAFMAPTEILASQHYTEVNKYLSQLGITAALITGSTTQRKKQDIYDKILTGEIDILIGTHALISDKVNFKRLGLVITDEQHRFGVAQRGALKDKASRAHMLVMSATPIPRTLALAMYGDLDVSKLDQAPSGRQRVDTYVVDESFRQRINTFIEKQVSLGGQCYVVCPAIEKTDIPSEDTLLPEYKRGFGRPMATAVEFTENLRKELPNIEIACLHGRMSAREKNAIMSDFASGKISVLVSTTVIEVGINVPNASLMIVENAEQFGLSQLHQLRGRVGRGTQKSYCILVSSINSPTAKSRLDVMRTTYDGFEIAEKDLLLRGPGDFFSPISKDNIRQSGGFDFKVASITSDTKLFEDAFSSAKELLGCDNTLSLPEHSILREMVINSIAPQSTIS